MATQRTLDQAYSINTIGVHKLVEGHVFATKTVKSFRQLNAAQAAEYLDDTSVDDILFVLEDEILETTEKIYFLVHFLR